MWVVFVNLMMDFLPCNMPEFFNKTGHGLTDVVIAGDKIKPVLHPESIFGNNGTYIYCVLEWN